MMIIPIQAVASQIVGFADAGGRPCQVNIYQKSTGLFADVLVNNAVTVSGVLCLNATLLVRSLYLGFNGDVLFFDTQGHDDPTYTGLGSRFLLVYVAAAEVTLVTPQSLAALVEAAG